MKAPPHNLEAEQALLGAVMLNNDVFEKADGLLPLDFFDPLHGAIWQAISDNVSANRPATPVTMRSLFQTALGPDGQPAWHYLGKLVADTPGWDVGEYARIIREDASRRRLILCFEEATADAYEHQMPPGAVIESVEQNLATIADAQTSRVEIGMKKAATDAVELANAAFKRGDGLAGLSTGIVDIDKKLGGLRASNLIILAGRPGIGKSALAINIAVNIANGLTDHETGEVIAGHVHLFSQEMSATELAMRVIGERSGISSYRIGRGDFHVDDMKKIKAASDAVGALPITIDETGNITLARLAARARRLKRRRDTRLIVIDYLQLMAGADGRGGDNNKVQQLTAITMGLKGLAKDLAVPILCLAQLSRKVEDRPDKKPQLADLRDSGSIEQDADSVLFVYRDDYYLDRERPPEEDANGLPSPKHEEWKKRMANSSGKAELIIAKNRHGPPGTVHLAFDAAAMRFSSLAREVQ